VPVHDRRLGLGFHQVTAIICRGYGKKISPSHVIGFARGSCITSMKAKITPEMK